MKINQFIFVTDVDERDEAIVEDLDVGFDSIINHKRELGVFNNGLDC